MAAKAGKLGAVYCQTADAAVAFTNEATTGDAGHLRYTINNADKRYWDTATALVVKVNGTPVSTGFTIEYVGGVVVFASSQGAAVITVTGAYLTVSQVATFFNWSLSVAMDTIDISVLGTSAKEYLPTLRGWNGSAEAYWADGRFLAALGTKIVLVLYTDDSAGVDTRYEGFAYVTGNGVQCDTAEAIRESIDFEGCGDLYYRAG